MPIDENGDLGSGEFSKNHCCHRHCFCCPSSSRAQIDQPDPDTPAPPVPGGSRARQLGFRVGRILGMVVRGLVNTRGLNKKQLMEKPEVVEEDKGEGYQVDWDRPEGYEREDGQ